MPLHDWRKAEPGLFHDFHTAWMVGIRNALNGGLLPAGFRARTEQKAETYGPDVLTLETATAAGGPGGGVALAEPKVDVRVTMKTPPLAGRRVVIRHSSGKRIVAIVEIVSPANKDRPASVGAFAGKVAEFLQSGVHVAVLDVFPPGPSDPDGLHVAVCDCLEDATGAAPPSGKPFTFAGYRASRPPVGYLSYAALGDPLPDVPLFLDDRHVVLPVEATYMAEFAHLVPEEWPG